MCPDRETLSAFYDNEVEGKFSITIENHIEECNKCRKDLSVMESASTLFSNALDEKDIPVKAVWGNIQSELDRKNRPDIWHRKINIPLPLLAAASFLVIMITALLSTLLFNSYGNDYRNFTVSEAVNINNDNQYHILNNDQTVQVELQLPADAFFQISGTPQLIRKVDYLQANE